MYRVIVSDMTEQQAFEMARLVSFIETREELHTYASALFFADKWAKSKKKLKHPHVFWK